VSEPETAAQLRGLLERLDEARRRLEQAESSEAAVDILQDLADIAKETQATIDRARREGPRPAGSDAPA
jgi:ATP phosphoribosyltransferase regulatory subunit HisZ